jgi:predicted DNA-binding transcriptional regulator AlpA
MTTSAIPRLTLNLPEAAAALGCDRTTLYRLAKVDGFPLRRMGGKSFVLVDELETWVRSRPLGVAPGVGAAGVAARQERRAKGVTQ